MKSALFLLLALVAHAQSTISPANPFAWGANIGWVNARPSAADGDVAAPRVFQRHRDAHRDAEVARLPDFCEPAELADFSNSPRSIERSAFARRSMARSSMFSSSTKGCGVCRRTARHSTYVRHGCSIRRTLGFSAAEDWPQKNAENAKRMAVVFINAVIGAAVRASFRAWLRQTPCPSARKSWRSRGSGSRHSMRRASTPRLRRA